VYKKIKAEKDEAQAIIAMTYMTDRTAGTIPLDETLALFAADISLRHKLAMADAIIYATTLQQKALLVTSDHHFEGLEHVLVLD
ncbi:MAG: type II toxin-antitoxin system VapC family toxin, partial [Deltaproteobacteria bacterium]|nr:type II toxin-antitoxin system VapC family toxin [Deltaproteobacteria bacterium]